MLLDLIRQAVHERLGPGVGAALSGGIDSSTVKALAGDVPTFTGFYQGEPYDERPYARLVAGSDHHEIEVTPQDFIDNFDDMIRHARRPFQGPGTFGQYMVAKYASEHVGALLSGEGGDELFGGYARLLIVAGERPPDGYEDYTLPADYPDSVEAALAYDFQRLPLLLAVDDQMTAAWGIEARSPFTDPRVVDYVLSRPAMERVGKRMLKEAVRGLVPDQILQRTDKRGFPSPLVEWAQGPLSGFIGDRLGYLPDPSRPWARDWWLDLCERASGSVEAAA